MKQTIAILLTLFVLQSAQAMIVSVNGKGEIGAEGMDLVITDAPQDPLTGKSMMKLEGDLLTSASALTVKITRSATGLTDEFCCGSNCTAGNGEREETKNFGINGLTHWYVHYTPVPNSDETITYEFSDGEQTLQLRVRYTYVLEGVEQVRTESRVTKMIQNGTVYILRDGQAYTLSGTSKTR